LVGIQSLTCNEAWGRLSQILKDILAQDADVEVCIILGPLGKSSHLVADRNMVTSLFEHEQISTTLPKARDAARLAEKVRLPVT